MTFDQDSQWRFNIADNLLNNASDMIHHVAEHLSYGRKPRYYDIHQLKMNLSSIQNALECLLKFRLAWYDWRLVVSDPVKIDNAAIKSGDFKTITFDDSRKLLKKAPFSIDLSQLKAKPLYELRNNRHKHTHYHLELDEQKCLELIAFGIDFCLEFYADQVYKQFYEEFDRFKKIDLMLRDIDCYTAIRIKTAKKKQPYFQAPLTSYFDCCPNCEQSAPVINSPDTVMCLYCKSEDQIYYVAENVGSGLNESADQTQQCPECLYQSMGVINLEHTPESWQCVMCGYYTNVPQNFNYILGGLQKRNISKPERRKKIRWPYCTELVNPQTG
ncbi:hypothetical protein [Pedobacter kyonggii]|uniref:Uncharacterized protein n=1 Tax=Pedobacter kyonggii TaxID=1926871 RepID=A0A4Q9HGU3_9SPHI|nr:hypothetical protein [Pedobacter kyonggii]TBO44473.1 hypothetical protein EYS08_03975 [Pedobacter kyonggii]